MAKGYRLYGAILFLAVAAFAMALVSAAALAAPGGHNQGGGVQARAQGPQGAFTPTATGTATPCTGWDVVASPNITTTTNGNYLEAVSGAAPDDLWAVGYYVNPDFYQRTLVERRDGNSWTIASSTDPGSSNNVLFGVAALPNEEAWAVGRFNNTNIQNTLIEHCTSTGCTDVTSPNGPGSNVLFGVAAIGNNPNDVWAVGQDCDRPLCTTRTTLTLHYTGTWTLVTSPNSGPDFNGLFGVAGSAPNDVWAVGQACQDAACNTSKGLIIHWDGNAWGTPLTFGADTAYTVLNSVAVRDANDAWAVGQTCPDSDCSSSTSLTLHWDGSSWTQKPSPNPGTIDTHLNAVAIAGPNDAWATGSATNDGTTYFNPMLHWDGNNWTPVDITSPGTVDNDLRGLAAVSPVDVWAVGDMDSGSGELTQIQRYTGPCGATTPTATTTSVATITSTATVTATPGSPTATPTVCTISFSDVQPSDYFYNDVRCVYCLGAVSGYADGTFRPFNNTTRGQMTKIIVIALQIAIVTPTGTATPTFNDVPANSPFYTWIETAAADSIVSGYDCGGPGEPCPGRYFRPNANVTRGQLSKIVVVAANQVYGWDIVNPVSPTFTDVPPGSPFYVYIETAYCHTVISGYADHTFRPGNNAIRAQIAKIVCNTSQNPASTCPAPPTPTATSVPPTETATATSTVIP